MLKNEKYEYLQTVDKLSNNNKIHAVDIGANTGEVTNILSKHWNKVTAFEPTPDTFEYLKNNVNQNVSCKNIGLSNTKDSLKFITGKDQRKNQIVSNDFTKKGWETISIEVTTLDSFNFSDVDFLKIDVEGHERHVVLGAEQTIKKCKPLIVIEISFEKKVYDKSMSKNHSEALDILQSWGYKIQARHKHDYVLEFSN